MINWAACRGDFLYQLHERLISYNMRYAADIVFSVYWGNSNSLVHIKWLLSQRIREENITQKQREEVERAFKAITKWSKGERRFEL